VAFIEACVYDDSSFIDVSNASVMSYANEAVTLMLQHHLSANVLVGYAHHHCSEADFEERVIVAVGR
jgi:hypothetical protein